MKKTPLLPPVALMHHAYAVEGTENSVPAVLFALEKSGIAVQGNPDISVRISEVLKVDDARALSRRSLARPLAGGPNIFILAFESATKQTQNALLKTLEDPSSDSVFFLVTPNPEGLIPTLLSRVEIIRVEEEEREMNEKADEFMSQRLAARIQMVAGLCDKDSGRGEVGAFLRALERAIEKRNFAGADMSRALRCTLEAQMYHNDNGAMTKMLLEYVALSLPHREMESAPK